MDTRSIVHASFGTRIKTNVLYVHQSKVYNWFQRPGIVVGLNGFKYINIYNGKYKKINSKIHIIFMHVCKCNITTIISRIIQTIQCYYE